jgi:hypothetical protein
MGWTLSVVCDTDFLVNMAIFPVKQKLVLSTLFGGPEQRVGASTLRRINGNLLGKGSWFFGNLLAKRSHQFLPFQPQPCPWPAMGWTFSVVCDTSFLVNTTHICELTKYTNVTGCLRFFKR